MNEEQMNQVKEILLELDGDTATMNSRAKEAADLFEEATATKSVIGDIINDPKAVAIAAKTIGAALGSAVE